MPIQPGDVEETEADNSKIYDWTGFKPKTNLEDGVSSFVKWYLNYYMGKMKTILVTGGSGFIGSHTCFCLLKNKYKIIVVDSNVNSSKLSLKMIKKIFDQNKEFMEEIIFHQGDIRDEKFLKKVFLKSLNNGYQIDGVIHLAGLKSVEESTKYPLMYWDNNVYGTLTLLKVMELFNCETIVFSSSATVYGSSNKSYKRIPPKSKPFNPYGHNKSNN